MAGAGFLRAFGGEGGIRTPDRLAPMPHFECGAFDHSATSPGAITERLLASRSGRVLGEDGGADKAREAGISLSAGQPVGKGVGPPDAINPGGPVSRHCNCGPEVRLRWPA